jgi:hypothetical protein
VNRARLAFAAMAAFAWLALAPALAQQSGQGRAPVAGGAQGTVGGGASGGVNVGGAGGVSNPSPGGSSPDAGGPRERDGPNETATQRSGYLGGRTTESDGGGGGTVVPVPVPATRIGSGVNCHEANPSGMTPTARLSSGNVVRIDSAQAALHGAGSAVSGDSGRYLMASLQEELAKAAPDLSLAGTYVGMTARQPVTPEMVLSVSEVLCVPLNRAQAASISAVAEDQRRQLNGGAR